LVTDDEAPLLRPLLDGGDAGSFLTRAGVDGGATAFFTGTKDGLDADPEDDELAAMRRGCQLFPRRRLVDALDGGGIVSTGELPPSMCSRTLWSVLFGALHQRRRPAALLRGGGGGGPS
jgi:hypothetical protein